MSKTVRACNNQGQECSAAQLCRHLDLRQELSGIHITHQAIISLSEDLVTLQGINWFGFETLAIVAGLWTQSQITNDFQYVAWRIKLLGFNTIRLPFSFQVSPLPKMCIPWLFLCTDWIQVLLHAFWLTALMRGLFCSQIFSTTPMCCDIAEMCNAEVKERTLDRRLLSRIHIHCHRGATDKLCIYAVSCNAVMLYGHICAVQTILNMEIDSVLFPYCTPSTYSDVLASVTPPNITLRADAIIPPPVWFLHTILAARVTHIPHVLMPADLASIHENLHLLLMYITAGKHEADECGCSAARCTMPRKLTACVTKPL